MTWTRLSDDFTDRPAMLQVSRDARLLQIEAMIWCNRMLTDGTLPAAAVRRLTDSPDPDAAIDELVGVGLWKPVDAGGAWSLDWAEQEAGDEVRKRREANAERQRTYRRRRELHNAGDHTMCDPRHCRNASKVTRDVTRYETPSRPDPSRPDPQGGTGTGAARTGSADASPTGDLRDQTPCPPHAFVPGPDDDDDTRAYPCDRCDHPSRHLAHHAHHFNPDPKDNDECADCNLGPQAAAHTYIEHCR